MRRYILLLGSVAAIGVMAGTGVMAQGPGPGADNAGRGGPAVAAARRGGGPGQFRGPGRGRGGVRPLGAALDLTADQRTQIQKIMRDARDQAGPLTDQLQLARKTLRRDVFADTPDAQAVTKVSGQIATLEKQVADIRLHAMTAAAGVLTPEQRETVRTGPADVFGRGGRMGAMGRRGPGPGPAGPRGRQQPTPSPAPSAE